MQSINILPLVPVTDTWSAFTVPDRARKSISFQLESLGVLEYSLDGGSTSMKVVGTGDTLFGNFSLKTIYFKVPIGTDNVQIRTQDFEELR